MYELQLEKSTKVFFDEFILKASEEYSSDPQFTPIFKMLGEKI